MENRSHALVVGVFIIVLALMLASLVSWWGRDAVRRTSYVLSSLGNITGLRVESAVRYRGMEVGKVTSIKLNKENARQILVHIDVDESLPVTSATYAELNTLGLTGLAFIQLDNDPSVRNPVPADPDQAITIRPSLFERLSVSGDQLFVQVGTVLDRLNAILDQKNRSSLQSTLNNFAKVSDELVPTLQQFRVSMQDISHQVGGLATAGNNTLKESQRTIRGIEALSEDWRRRSLMLEEFSITAKKMGELTDNLKVVVGSINSLSTRIQEDTLPRVNHVVADTQRGLVQIQSLLDRIEANPHLLLFGGTTHPPGPGETGFAYPPPRVLSTPPNYSR